MGAPFITWLEDLRLSDVAAVGGKNAALGELLQNLRQLGIAVPGGFACTAAAYQRYVGYNGLAPRIVEALGKLERDELSLRDAGQDIRAAFLAGNYPDDLASAIVNAYGELERREGQSPLSVAVRSSATAEDLPTASFAGQQETFLNIRGEAALLASVKRCFASLYTDRAITYRKEKGFAHVPIALSVGVQRLVRADVGAAGVAFTLDTESGFPDVVTINAAHGLGEHVVKGIVNPDEIWVWKPGLSREGLAPILRKQLGAKERMLVFAEGGTHTTKNVETLEHDRGRFAITDEEALRIARWSVAIEEHFSRRAGRPTPVDVEWAKDGTDGQIYIVQARAETVHAQDRGATLRVFSLREPGHVRLRGRAVGSAIANGPVRIVRRADAAKNLPAGVVLVAEMTDPDWMPLLKRASGIITDRGGRTCHAAIVARELGIPAIVGTGDATQELKDGDFVTLSCAQGEEGLVYAGSLAYEQHTIATGDVPKTKTQILLNIAQPGAAFATWRLPVDGVGLARLEFIITSEVKIHPMALAMPDHVTSARDKDRIDDLVRHNGDPRRYFIEKVGRAIATLAAPHYPKTAIVRMSDFKTNEYARLLGGAEFEPREENPMLGFRGASRYYSPRYRPGFELECQAVRYARETLGLDNIAIMIPFCRTLEEADRVLDVMASQGLVRGQAGLRAFIMCEIPANAVLLELFAARFDGISIGSNDLTQLVLGVDRDSALLADLFDEVDPAVIRVLRDIIARAKAIGTHVALCGQRPSDDPGFAKLLVDAGIDAMSVDPDSVLRVREQVAASELRAAQLPKGQAQEPLDELWTPARSASRQAARKHPPSQAASKE